MNQNDLRKKAVADLPSACGKTVSDEDIEKMQRAMAIMIAEHEVMRAKLIELDIIYRGTNGSGEAVGPLRWKGNGQPIVDIDEVVRRHMRGE